MNIMMPPPPHSHFEKNDSKCSTRGEGERQNVTTACETVTARLHPHLHHHRHRRPAQQQLQVLQQQQQQQRQGSLPPWRRLRRLPAPSGGRWGNGSCTPANIGIEKHDQTCFYDTNLAPAASLGIHSKRKRYSVSTFIV